MESGAPEGPARMIELQEMRDLYVCLITGRYIEIQANAGRIGRDLADLGFEPEPGREGVFQLAFSDDGQRNEFMAQIRDLGIPFSYGPGWAPSEVFAHLRDQGTLSGSFKKIFWRGPNRIVISDE